MTSRTPDRSFPWARAVVVLLVGAVVSALGWLNRTPWWGWMLALGLVVGLAVALHRLRHRRLPLRAGAGLLGAILACTTIVLASPSPGTRAAGGDDPTLTEPVASAQGPVRGVVNDAGTVEIFAGIPYAAPPVGERRWRAPEPPPSRASELVADRFSAVPIQPTSTFVTRALSQVVEAPLEGTLLNPYRTSEDSLTLNIWRSTRPSSEALPVLVYIPGGGFSTGSGALPLYDGEALASRGDVITVTINYRLGVLGFLSHPDLADESADDASGNYGILDQIAALTWLRQNIASFGGDPERVTIAGESAGGQSVCILGASPAAAGLFDGIIGGSGACMGTTGSTERGDQFDTRAAAEEAGRALSARLGGATIDELRRMPVDRLLDAAADLGAHWRPSIDGHVLPRPPAEIYAAGEQNDVPLLVGSNADEASLALAAPPDVDPAEYRASAAETHGADAAAYLQLYPGESPEEALTSSLQAETDRVMTRAMIHWAQLQSHSGAAPAYLYFFTRTPPDPALQRYGAYHGAEIAYAFDNLGVDHDADYTDADRRLRDEMSAAWLAFVRTGDPNAAGAPAWPALRDAPTRVMEFAAGGGRLVEHPRAAAVAFWLEYDGPIP